MDQLGRRNGCVVALTMKFADGDFAQFGKDLSEERVDVLGIAAEISAEALCKRVLVRHAANFTD